MGNYSFRTDFRINSHSCDLNNHIRPSGLLQYLQETANLHIESSGKGYDVLKKEGRAFILSRVAVTLNEPLYAYERVTGATTPTESRGASFNRFTTLEKGGRQIAVLSSLWALVNVEDKSLIRVNDSHLDLPIGETLSLDAPLKFRIPADLSLKPLGTIKANYSLCDRNRHMNNTTYPDELCNLLPDLDGKRIKDLSICYQNEMPLGEEAEVLSGRDAEGVCFFRTLRKSDGKVGVEARMVFADLPVR
jgi:acyl-CoA thioesterase FadM